MEQRTSPIAAGLATASLFGYQVKRRHYARCRPASSPLPGTKASRYFNVGRLLALKFNLADSQRLQKQQEKPGVETPSTNAASQCPRSNHYAFFGEHLGQLAGLRHPPLRGRIQEKSAREFLPGVIQFRFHARAFKKYYSSVLLRNLPAASGHFSGTASGNLTRDVTNLSPHSNLTLYS